MEQVWSRHGADTEQVRSWHNPCMDGAGHRLFLADDRQSVAQGKNHLLHPCILCDKVVESFDAYGLEVCAVWLFFEHMSVPQCIVGNDVASSASPM